MTTIAEPARQRAPRDVRLDFFRGLGMLIIFMAHSPGNPWNDWIPARFGFSSAAELFVFCSGFASASAFGKTFERQGFALGTARTAKRLWEVYWAHVGLFVALAALAVIVRALGWGDAYYLEHVDPIARDAATAILGLVTLRWLPAYLDILPMYLVILALIPVIMAAQRIHAAAPLALVAGLYATGFLGGINLVGNPWTGTGWFFNPLAWQAIFFAGFAFGMGWIKGPRLGVRGLTLVCAAFVVAAVPLSFWGIQQAWPAAMTAHDWLLSGAEKTELHPLRILHFLALAYLALSLIDRFKIDLVARGGRHVIKVGQQSLASFLLSLVLARLAGIAFGMIGHDPLPAAAINLASLGCIILGAYAIGWFKSAPWARRAAPPPPQPVKPAAPVSMDA